MGFGKPQGSRPKESSGRNLNPGVFFSGTITFTDSYGLHPWCAACGSNKNFHSARARFAELICFRRDDAIDDVIKEIDFLQIPA